MNKELYLVINEAGSQKKLRDILNTESEVKKCTQQSISYWLRSGTGVPRYWALLIKKIYPVISLEKLLSET